MLREEYYLKKYGKWTNVDINKVTAKNNINIPKLKVNYRFSLAAQLFYANSFSLISTKTKDYIIYKDCKLKSFISDKLKINDNIFLILYDINNEIITFVKDSIKYHFQIIYSQFD